jgi:predicted DNA-binding protein
MLPLSERLEIRIDPPTQAWLQNFSAQTGKSQGEILRVAIAQIQVAAQFIEQNKALRI